MMAEDKDFFDNLANESALLSDKDFFDNNAAKTEHINASEVAEDSGYEDGGAESLSDRTFVSKSSGEYSSDICKTSSGESAGAPGVKEVGWSAFHADSVGNEGTGFGSYSDFFSQLSGVDTIGNGHVSAFTDQKSEVQDWESQYPGWKYDSSTGQWFQIDDYDSSTQKNEVSYIQPTAEIWNQASHYPPHMVFDPQYPGWYYDTITQKWCALDSYANSVQVHEQTNPAAYASVGNFYQDNCYNSYNSRDQNWASPVGNYIPLCSNRTMEDHCGQSFPLFNDQKNAASNNFSVNQSPSGRFLQQNFSYSPATVRSASDRPPHALVTFGFGGKLIVLKHTESFNAGCQNPVGGPILILGLAEVVRPDSYFQALCQRCVPGPLSSGSVGCKELNKWIDERISNPESADSDFRKAEVLKLLLSLLKIACQYYGKLRSPYVTDAALKESDVPELAIARLFACAKRNGSRFSQHGGAVGQMPSEGQMQVAAAQVQSLLVSGMKKEALECAQEGRLWGPALVLAAQLGDQFYVETIKKMALCQFEAGSPLRTLCLLIASQPAEVFSADNAVNTTQKRAQFGANGMLDCWEENLAVITANRTKDDELVLMHLGDCLWKDRSDVNAAHICYLVAEANFEPYSDTSRMCLVGADHWKFPRTYASPEAIQRTEVYEYSKTLGNSQFVLLSFQPYKLIYAQMLAEVGRMSDALKYCQAVLKSLKNGRSPDTLRHQVLSLEERIKAHQHGGFSTNLAPKRFVGKLLNLIDNTARVVVNGGGIPPPIPSPGGGSGGGSQGNENNQSLGGRVSASQSTMAMSSLVPSSQSSKGPTADKNRKIKHTRSLSEPDVGRSPRQGHTDFSKDESSTGGLEEKTSAAGGTSRLGRFTFGSQLFQKTVGFVLKPRQDRQAKLGETNKFYYDEKLKRWVEEGSSVPAEEAAAPSAPPTTSYKNPSLVDNNNPGIPPIPPTSNQHSTRGRTGVRSRYVDTFNKGGEGSTNYFQSTPSVPTPVKPPNRNFFVPAPVSPDSYEPQSSTSMQKIASLNNISNQGAIGNGSFPGQSRRTTSWGGGLNDSGNVKPLGEVLGMHPSSFMQGEASVVCLSKNRDDLHEVEL